MHSNKKIFENSIIFFIFAMLILFILYPFVCIFLKSIHIDGVFNISNYFEVIDKYKITILNSILVSICSSILSVFISISVTFFIAKQNKKINKILYLIILLALVSPPFVSSLAYLILYGRRGLITYGLFKLSLDPYNAFGIVMMQGISFSPLNIIFLLSIIERIDKNAINSANDLGASGKDIFLDIIIPLIKPSLVIIFLLTFVRSICDFATPTIVGGRFSTFSSEIYMQIVGFSNIEKAATMNVILMIPSIILFVIYFKLVKNNNTVVSRSEVKENLKLKKMGIIGIVINIFSLIYLVFIFLQYFCIFFYSVYKKSRGQYVFTTEYLEKFMNYDFSSLVRSIEYAIIVALICTFVSLIITYVKRKNNNISINIINVIIMLPFMIPGTYFGLSYILAFNGPYLKLTGTAFIVILNILFKQLPMTTKMCEGAFLQIPNELDNACIDLGGSKFNVIFDIIIPKISATISAIVLYNFNSAMTTAGSILFLIDPAKKLAIFDLFDSIYIGEYHEACVLSTMIILVVIIFSIVLGLLEKKLKRV